MSVAVSYPTRADLVLRHATVVDVATSRLIPDQTVVVRDGVISEIADDAAFTGAGAAAISGLPTRDLDGAFAMPGLINMHTHFSLSLPGQAGEAVEAMGPGELALYMADGAARTLRNGVTTVRCVAEKGGLDFALRRAIDAGHVLGPSIRTAGRALACTGGHGHGSDDTIACDGPVGFTRGVRSQVAAGADLIKLMISGGIAGEHEGIATPQLTREEMAAAIRTAHDWGRKVTAHAGPASIIELAVELGLDCVEHGYQLTADVARAMAAHGTALVPTLVVTHADAFFEELGVPAWMRERSAQAAIRHRESFRHALDAGVEIMLGSDMPPFWPFEGTTAVVRELEHMHDAGLDAWGVLRAATMNPATWLGLGERVGRVEVGFDADLVITREDPSAAPAALRSIEHVVRRGVLVREAAA